MASRPKVHIYQPVDETGESHKQLEAAGAAVNAAEHTWGFVAANMREKVDIVLDPDTVVGVGVANLLQFVTRETIAGAPDLRVIAKYTVGFDNVDVDAATEHGVLVVHSPTESNWGGVAEGTVANILTILKKTRERDRLVKGGRWRDMSLRGYYLGERQDGYAGMTLGLVGLGRTGSRVADLFAPWRMRIIASDPYVDESKFAIHNATPVDLDTLLEQSDIVSVHTALTKETRGMFGAEQFAKMKSSAIFVNTARGPIVDVAALTAALERDEIAAAALDVLPDEPPDPELPLFGLGDKLLVSPHMIAMNFGAGLGEAIPWVNDAVLAALRGELPRHVVNPEAVPKWLERFGGKSLI